MNIFCFNVMYKKNYDIDKVYLCNKLYYYENI